MVILSSKTKSNSWRTSNNSMILTTVVLAVLIRVLVGSEIDGQSLGMIGETE